VPLPRADYGARALPATKPFNGFPLLPKHPSQAFLWVYGSAFGCNSLLLARCVPLLYRGQMKRAQRALQVFMLSFGGCSTGASFLAGGGWPLVLTLLMGLGILAVAALLEAFLRRTQVQTDSLLTGALSRSRSFSRSSTYSRRTPLLACCPLVARAKGCAMTPKLEQDIAAYRAAWAELNRDPEQRRALGEIEALLRARKPVLDALKLNQRRRALNVEKRDTRDQLMIMITQAWGLNDRFQAMAVRHPTTRLRDYATTRLRDYGRARALLLLTHSSTACFPPLTHS